MSNRDDRVLKILKILDEHPRISIKRLIELTGESTSTMRRDLIILEEAGKVRRSFGMVTVLDDTNVEFTSSFRYRTCVEEKKTICRLLAREVLKDNLAMFIDLSTTAAYLPEYLPDLNNLRIITNNLRFTTNANKMDNLSLFVVGGTLRPNSDSLIGSHAIQDVEMFRPQLAIVSCSTIDYTGAYVTDMEQAEIKWQMMKNARESILLVDHTKFHPEYSDYIHLADLSSWSTIVTDVRPKNSFLLKMKQLGVKVIYPGFK